MIKTGLIGNGYWGKILEDKLNGVSELIFVQTSNDYNPKVFKEADWIFIATPKETHFDIARDCIIEGVNVFLEKPATNTVEEYIWLIELAKLHNVKLYISNVFLYREECVAIKKPLPHNVTFVWYKGDGFNGSIVDDLLYHDLYILNTVLDNEVIKKVNIYNNEVDRLFFSITFASSKEVYFDYRREEGLTTKKIIHFGDAIVVFPKTQDDPLNRIIIDCILGNIDLTANFELNLKTLSLMGIIKQQL